MRVLFRADCSRSVGTGHLFRCREIARYFKDKGSDVCFVINDYAFNKDIVAEFPYHTISYADINEEITKTDLLLSRLKSDVIFVDFYDKSSNAGLMDVFHRNARQEVVALTDDYNKVCIASDLLVACHPRQVQYDYSGSGQRVLAGEQFLVVSAEFMNAAVEVRPKAENVLVTFGGHDPDNVMHLIARSIASGAQERDFSNMIVHFLVGGIYKFENQLRKFLEKTGLHSVFHKKLPSVLTLFKKTDIAITAGGNTLYELCRLGVPCIAVGLNRRQHEACRILQERGLVEYAGYYTDIETKSLFSMLAGLLDSYDRRFSLHAQNIEHFKIDPLDVIYAVLTGERYETTR